MKLVRRADEVIVINVGKRGAFEWNIDPKNDSEEVERGISFDVMQSWEHNEGGPLEPGGERTIAHVVNEGALSQTPR